jgi:hypothetical protein
MIIDKGNPKFFESNLYSATCSPQAPCSLPCGAHKTNASRKHIVIRARWNATRANTKSYTAKYTADLIVYYVTLYHELLRSRVISGDIFGKRNATYEAEKIRLIATCRIKLITSNDYSPTNKSLFCLLKLLTQTCDLKSNWGTSPARMR